MAKCYFLTLLHYSYINEAQMKFTEKIQTAWVNNNKDDPHSKHGIFQIFLWIASILLNSHLDGSVPTSTNILSY